MAISGDERASDLTLDTPVTYFKEVEGRDLLTPERELELGKQIQDCRGVILDKSLEIIKGQDDSEKSCERIESWMEDSHKSPLSVEDVMTEAREMVYECAAKMRKTKKLAKLIGEIRGGALPA